jgi:excinuclease ABC subunit A
MIDIGPGAGDHGGKIVCCGPIPEIFQNTQSTTIKYLTGECAIMPPEQRRPMDAEKNCIEIKGCRENNLKNIDVRIPLGGVVCVTGVSGSGKSTLVNQTLLPALRRKLNASRVKAGAFKQLAGASKIRRRIRGCLMRFGGFLR